MYSVIGGDGQVYGPVSMETLTEWSLQGRILPDTNLIDGVNGRVIRAKDVNELQDRFASAPPVIAQGYQTPVQPSYQTPGSGHIPPHPAPNVVAPPYAASLGAQPYPPAPSVPHPNTGVQVNNYVSLLNASVPNPAATADGSKSKVVAILLCVFFGALGIHRFYLGRNNTAIGMLLITGLSLGYFIGISCIWAVVDLIMICTGSLRDSDERALV